jgi:hypothetical protein
MVVELMEAHSLAHSRIHPGGSASDAVVDAACAAHRFAHALLDIPPNEHPALMLPRLLVRVAQEMTIVCSAITISVTKPEPQAQPQQHPKQHLGVPPRRLLTVVSVDKDNGSSQTVGSPVGSLGASSSNSPWASLGTGAGASSSGGGASGECSRRHSSGGGAVVDAAVGHTAPQGHGLGSTGPAHAPHQAVPPQPQREPDASRLLESLDAAALRGEFAVIQAIEAVCTTTGAPVRRVRIGAATKGGMGIARYRPPPRRGCVVGAPQQLARPAADGAAPGVIAALKDAHRECRDLLGAVAKVLADARAALPSPSSEAHGGGGSGAPADIDEVD